MEILTARLKLPLIGTHTQNAARLCADGVCLVFDYLQNLHTTTVAAQTRHYDIEITHIDNGKLWRKYFM